MLSRLRIEQINAYFELKLNYRFNNPDLLIQALTRASAKGYLVKSDAQDFESLEFLGDRILNLAVTSRLQALDATATPGDLQQKYVALTRNSDGTKRNGGPLFRVAKELNLESFILKSATENLAQHGERGKKISSTKKTKEGILSDHVEALLAAIYLDSDDGFGSGLKPVIIFISNYWAHLGLNEDYQSESNFGDSIVSSHAVVHQKQLKQNSILIASANTNNWPQAQMALDNGAEIETVDAENKTALIHFASWGNTEAVADLLQRTANTEQTDVNGWTAVLHAAQNGRLSALRMLLGDGAIGDKEIIKDENSINIMSLAAVKNHHQIITFMTLNYLYLFSKKQLDNAIVQAQAKNRTHVLKPLRNAIQQIDKSAAMFNAFDNLVNDTDNRHWLIQLKNIISTGADVRIRKQDNNTLFHLMGNIPQHLGLLRFILKMKPKLDGIILEGVTEDIFAANKNSDEDAIEELANLSFKQADLSNFSFASIKRFSNVDFSEAIMVDVIFHPHVIMDAKTLATLPIALRTNSHVNLHYNRELSIFNSNNPVDYQPTSTSTRTFTNG